jgi:hypothetical protein
MRVNKSTYQNGGRPGDPIKDKDEAIAFAKLLADYNARLDQGEIRPLKSPKVMDRVADVATMLANPLDAIKASRRYDTLLPTRGQMRAVETPMGATMQALNPIDDIAAFLSSQASDSDLEQAIGPLIALLPSAVRGDAQKMVDQLINKGPYTAYGNAPVIDQLRRHFNDYLPNVREMDLNKLDDVLRSSVSRKPEMAKLHVTDREKQLFGTELAVVNDLIRDRQKMLGYQDSRDAKYIRRAAGSNPLKAPPISTDPRANAMLTGTPSGNVVSNVLTHQGEGGRSFLGDLPSREMQRMAQDVTLTRVPRPTAQAARPYLVLRDGTPTLVPIEKLQPGDVMTSLSQPIAGYEQGRAVSTAALEDQKKLAHFLGEFTPSSGNFPPTFRIENTKGMPAAKPDLYRPRPLYETEDEITLSLQQPFRVLKTGDQSRSPRLSEVVLSPIMEKYGKGGKRK